MSTKAPSQPPPLDYDPDMFVDRDDEIEVVENKAKDLSLGKAVPERTVVFWTGYKGAGRTWLLRHLTETKLPKLNGVRALYTNLGEWARSEFEQPEEALREIIQYILTRCADWPGSLVKDTTLSADSLPEESNLLNLEVRRLVRDHVLVLLLDHVYESDWDLLALLEEYVLTPAVTEPHVLVVMAGRGRAYPWKNPELRFRSKDDPLQPFNEHWTREQLKKQRPDEAHRALDICKLSKGYPGTNDHLAVGPTEAEALRRIVDGWMEEIDSADASHLEALCVLRRFDEDLLPVLLAAYFEYPSVRDWPYKTVRNVRDRLLRTRMVQWREESGGWVVDEAIRPVLEKCLQLTEPEVWRRLHCVAYSLYASWQRQYPDEAPRWKKEADYHAGCLHKAGYAPDECVQGSEGGG